jgi:hypothetical protein
VWLSNGNQFAEPAYTLINDRTILDYDDIVGVGDFDGNGSTDVISLKRASGDVRVVATTFPNNAVMTDHCVDEPFAGTSHWICRAAVRSTYRWATGFATYNPGEGPLVRDLTTAPDNRWLGDSRGVLFGT